MQVSSEEWMPSQGIDFPDEVIELIKDTASNTAIIAGPGSGKTELLAQRASYLLETEKCVYPQKILALCFKVDAAANIKKRVEERCGKLSASRFISLTFDSFFISIVRRFSVFLPTWIHPISPDFEVRSINFKLGLDLNLVSNPQIQNDLNKHIDRNVLNWEICRSLAYTIIKNNADVRKLISSTYQFVFLDEFQDTTTLQYEFVKKIFEGQDNKITTVGDYNQMIMGWAGADLEVFNKFSDDFSAQKKTLNINHRSNSKIVDFINYILVQITPEGETPNLYSATRPPSERDSIFFGEYTTKEIEADAIAKYIFKVLQENTELNPNDFVLILRQKASDYFNITNKYFMENGLILRNEDAEVCENGMKIQDLMIEPISEFFINLVRKKGRFITPEQNKELIRLFANLINCEINDEFKYKKLMDDFNKIIAYLDFSIDTKIWTNKIIHEIGRDNFKRIKTASNESDFTKVKISFDTLFQEALCKTKNIEDAVDYYKGEGHIKLMTVHKSKGLEFHTVFFVDFNNKAWWSLSNASSSGNSLKIKEEQNTFFVGASRAKEKLIFTNGQKGKWPPVIKQILNNSKMLQSLPQD